MKVEELPQTLFLLRRKPSQTPDGFSANQPKQSQPKHSFVFGETTHGELVLFLWPTLPGALSWRLEMKMDVQIIEANRDSLIPAIQEKIPGCYLFFNAQPGETTYNLQSDRLIQLPFD